MSDRLIGIEKGVFIIAEIGVNYVLEDKDMEELGMTSALDVALAMIDEAASVGVDAVKFQSFTAEALQFQGTKKPGYAVSNVGSDEEVSYFEMIKKYELSRIDHQTLADHAASKDVIFFSTPYDRESADFLDDEIGVPIFKLASFELNNHLLLRHVARKGKPIILSTGLSTMDEVRRTVKLARREEFIEQLTLMQCTSDYPTRSEDVNLNVLKRYILEFPDVRVGLSDHCRTIIASLGAVAVGAQALEKHFTLNREFAGPDHKASLDPGGLKKWVDSIREMEECLGSYEKRITESEKKNQTMKRYLVISPQEKGTIIDEAMLSAKRTGHGVPASVRNLDKIVGRRLACDITEASRFNWDMIEG